MSRPFVGLLCLWMIVSGCDLVGSGESHVAYKIGFLSRRIPGSAEWQLFLMDSDGGNQERLSQVTSRCVPPVPSPDRSMIAFEHLTEKGDHQLHVIDLRDRSSRLLASSTRSCGQPGWSPRGDQIAFVMNREDAAEDKSLYITGVAGGQLQRLTDSGNANGPSWSPDGKSIAFSLSVEEGESGIYLVRPDGEGLRNIINHGCSPKWSPDGRQIAFCSGQSGSMQIYVMNADGGDARQMTASFWPSSVPGHWPHHGNHSATWSPDGSQIAYVSYPDGDPEIFVMNSDGTMRRRLTRAEKHDQDPSWTLNGKQILFSSKRNYLEQNTEIFVMHRNGSHQRPLSKFAGDDIYPFWVWAE